MSWLGIERQTGIITGMWAEKSRAIESCKYLAKRWTGSSWSVAEIDLSRDKIKDIQTNCYGKERRWLNHHQDHRDFLAGIFGERKNELEFMNFGEIMAKHEFNSNNTAFDVLTDYAFGGDKQAALEYLKTL